MLNRAGTWDHLLGGYLTATLEPDHDLFQAPELERLGARAGARSIVTVI